MKILIIGGTVFLGRALVEAARGRGHRVTLFNRGQSSPGAFPEIETIIGDRERDLDRLRGRRWDAAVDTCGYLPRHVRLSTAALRDSAPHYTFISSISVYPLVGAPNRDEKAPILPRLEDAVAAITGETYGPLKVACEDAVTDAYPDAAFIIRAGLIVGPHDPTTRFTYWVDRAARGGEAIAPPARQPLQFMDARDLADFIIRGLERRSAGIFNVTGPAERLTMGELLSTACQALATDTRFQHVSDEFLRDHEVAEFTGLPLWLHDELAERFMTFNFDKALAAGLSFRPLERTILDTRAWSKTRPADAPQGANLPPALERALLDALNL